MTLKVPGKAYIGFGHEPGMTLKAPGEVKYGGDGGVVDRIHFAHSASVMDPA